MQHDQQGTLPLPLFTDACLQLAERLSLISRGDHLHDAFQGNSKLPVLA